MKPTPRVSLEYRGGGFKFAEEELVQAVSCIKHSLCGGKILGKVDLFCILVQFLGLWLEHTHTGVSALLGDASLPPPRKTAAVQTLLRHVLITALEGQRGPIQSVRCRKH